MYLYIPVNPFIIIDTDQPKQFPDIFHSCSSSFLSTMCTAGIHICIPGIIQIYLRSYHISTFSKIFLSFWNVISLHIPEYSFLKDIYLSPTTRNYSQYSGDQQPPCTTFLKSIVTFSENFEPIDITLSNLKLAMEIFIPWKLANGIQISAIPEVPVVKHLPVYHCQLLLMEFIPPPPILSW